MSMKVTRIYTGDDGQSHFEDIDVALEDNGMIGAMSRRGCGQRFDLPSYRRRFCL